MADLGLTGTMRDMRTTFEWGGRAGGKGTSHGSDLGIWSGHWPGFSIFLPAEWYAGRPVLEVYWYLSLARVHIYCRGWLADYHGGSHWAAPDLLFPTVGWRWGRN